ncbi:hypothetical protein LTR22_015099 [Elasticomyces elasticus]|nr:hypothetical protein LTR22_015099 [Elasticomyces elasticus]KAK4916109.1 hypothetical protein LTR49_015883 [Elasticomyces elasticus]
MDMVIHGQRLSHSDCGHPTDGPGLSLTEGYAPFDQKSRGRWRGGWLKHIENYSGRKLTYESDKLDAVSGLAKQVATAVGDIYYAGLWKNHMIEDLCWRTYPVTEERMQVPQAHSAGSGWLKIKAPLLPIQRVPPDTKWEKTFALGFGTLHQMSTPHGLALGEIYFDLAENTGSLDLPNQLSTLVIDTTPNTSEASSYSALFLDSAHCLILKRHTPSHLYERVGLGKFMRTQEQQAGTDLKTYSVGRETPLGPLTSAHVRTQVTII